MDVNIQQACTGRWNWCIVRTSVKYLSMQSRWFDYCCGDSLVLFYRFRPYLIKICKFNLSPYVLGNRIDWMDCNGTNIHMDLMTTSFTYGIEVDLLASKQWNHWYLILLSMERSAPQWKHKTVSGTPTCNIHAHTQTKPLHPYFRMTSSLLVRYATSALMQRSLHYDRLQTRYAKQDEMIRFVYLHICR